jgi:hypothetical protein
LGENIIIIIIIIISLFPERTEPDFSITRRCSRRLVELGIGRSLFVVSSEAKVIEWVRSELTAAALERFRPRGSPALDGCI